MINIALGGSTGRMGQLLKKAIEQDTETQLKDVIEPIDVFIDFSVPSATLEYLEVCLNRSCAMVIGTTGLNESQKAVLKKASNHIPIVFSPNMSIGINVCYKLLDLASKILKDHQADIGISDIHHKHKKDAPSGTALRMGEVISKARGQTLPESGIQITSQRIGEVMGDHTVLFALPNEQIEITHKANDRLLFALGALKAAKWVKDKPPNLYDMQDVLGLNLL